MAKNTVFSTEADAAFFSSYDGVAVHEKMIKDHKRTQSYQDAIENNPQLFKDKTVLDIGTGTGILSMFCVRAGAKHVYATDVSNMIHNAKRIAEHNGMGDKITFIQGRVEDAKLPAIDIIVSEWMGFCLLSEIMLDCLLRARDKFLVPNGLLFPDKTSLFISGVQDSQMRSSKVDYWTNVHGLDFSPLKGGAIAKGFLRLPGGDSVVTTSNRVLDLDLQKVDADDLKLHDIPFRLVAEQDCTIDAFLAWFDYEFNAGSKAVHITTSPFTPPTHWKQTIFYFPEPLQVKTGDAISGAVSFIQHERDLDVRFSWDAESHETNGANGAHGSGLSNGSNGTNGTNGANGGYHPARRYDRLYTVDAVE